MIGFVNPVTRACCRARPRRPGSPRSDRRRHAGTDRPKLGNYPLAGQRQPGEVVATVAAIRRTLHGAGLDCTTSRAAS